MQTDSRPLVAVIGAGTMGAGIAQVAAAAGHPVIVVDADDMALDRGRNGVDASLDAMARRGSLSSGQKQDVLARIECSTDLGAAADAAVAIEAIAEQEDAKRDLFAALERIVGADCILASNTSSLSIERLAAGAERPSRVLGLHFFNPVPAMKLVEVIAGEHTDPALADQTLDLMRRWGKRPVLVRDVPGFIVNRVARPYYAEAFAALGEGLDPKAIDHALVSGGGFRMGPLALTDLIGQDVNYTVASTIAAAYGERSRFRLQPAQKGLVDAGRLGRKSGHGVFDYSADLTRLVLAKPGPTPHTILVSARGGTSVKLFREAGLVVREHPSLDYGFVEVDGVRFVMSDGRPLSARDDADVVADVARDFAVANTIVLAARDSAAGAAIAGLVQATGRSALLIPDRPGMLVLRTLAQLANAAADAIEDGVASVEGVDEAMVYGANHPEGPLYWAERASFKRVAAALDNIADATGDEIYRPAPLLRGS